MKLKSPAFIPSPASMAMLSHRLRRVLVAAPSCFQRSFSVSRTSNFPSMSSLSSRSLVKQRMGFCRFPAKLFSTTQYQYDTYTGEDSFTPDNEGCDFNHWLITMDFPKDNPPSREEMILIFEQTCAKGLGTSLEEAKKKIYALCTTSYQGFQAKMTIGEVEKFRDLPGVQYIIPDSYVDVENKLYGGDRYENGVITPGPIPVPTREGFDSLAKESTLGQEQAQRSLTPLDKGLTSGLVKGQESQMHADRRSFKPREGSLALIQGQTQGSRIAITEQGKGRGHGSQMPSFQRSFKRDQGTPAVRQWQAQGSQMPSFQGSFKHGQGTPFVGQGQGKESEMPSVQRGYNQGRGTPIHGQRLGTQMPSFQGSFKHGQGTPFVGQGQAKESEMPSVQRGYNQGRGTPIHGQRQGSQMPSYQMGYIQDQGAYTPPWQVFPNNYGQGAMANYSLAPPRGNFFQGTQENYDQMSHRNYVPAQAAGSPGFGHGYSGHGQGQIPSYQMNYSQGPGALVPPYQGNYIQGTPNYGQWTFTNYNQGPPHSNFPHGPQQIYNQGDQWNFSPQGGGNHSPTQFQHAQCHGNQMPQYQLSYNQGQGAPFPKQWQCPGCGMLSYLGSYNQGQGTPNPGQLQGQGCAIPLDQASYSHNQGTSTLPFQGSYKQSTTSYGQGTPGTFNQEIPVNYNQMGRGNFNPQRGQNYGPAHGEAINPGFVQGQNQTFEQEDPRNSVGNCSNNNNPTDPTETGRISH